MFQRKTVIEVIENLDIHFSDEIFVKVFQEFRRKKCNSKVKSISYKEICELYRKNPNTWLYIIQENVYIDSIHSYWEMNPFANAIIIADTKHSLLDIFYQTIRIFSYTPRPSSDIICLPNFSALQTTLEANSNLFYIYQYDKASKESSLVTHLEDLKGNDEIICVSKRFPYIVMKY